MNEIQEVDLLPQLELLLQEFLSLIENILQSGEILPDELQGELAITLERLTSRIDELRSMAPVEELPPNPPAEPSLQAGMPSSNIHSFGYDPENQRLLVKFQGDYPHANGPIYGYDNVPKIVFDLFRSGAVPARTNGKNRWGAWWQGKVPSLGASLYTLIKNGPYPYQRLS